MKTAVVATLWVALALSSAVAPQAGAAEVAPGGLPWNSALDGLGREPLVTPQNLRGYGALAIRQGRDLYIVDGDAPPSRAFRRVEHGATVRGMSWSRDGRWLAFATDGALWSVGRNATRPRRIPFRIAAGDDFDWSPRADVLCIRHSTGESPQPRIDPRRGVPGPSAQRIVFTGVTALVTPDGPVRILPIAAFPQPLRWTSDGRGLAAYVYTAFLPYANWTRATMALFSAARPAANSDAQAVIRARSPAGGQLAFAAAVPDADAMLFWRGQELSASAAADGLQLVYTPAPAIANGLGTMLTNPAWIAFSGDARAFVYVRGAGREAWHAKSLALCRLPRAHCEALPAPPGSVSVDPAWRPHDTRIAFVRAVDVGPGGGYGPGFMPNWVERRELWLLDTHTHAAQHLSWFGRGIFWPRWSNDGHRLLVYRDGEVWLGSPAGGKPKRIASGLVRPDEFADTFMFDHGMARDADAPVAWTGG